MPDVIINTTSLSSLGIVVDEISPRPRAGSRLDHTIVPGRDGTLRNGDSSLNAIVRTVSCFAEDPAVLEALYPLLDAATEARFSIDGLRYEKVSCDDEIDPEHYANGTVEFQLIFECSPYAYLDVDIPIDVTTSGSTVTNTGTVYTQPKITITATGDYSVVINGTQIDVTGVSNDTDTSVIIDSETMEVLETDGVTSATLRVSMDDFPTLKVGTNAVTWSGSVTNVRIDRRVRFR